MSVFDSCGKGAGEREGEGGAYGVVAQDAQNALYQVLEHLLIHGVAPFAIDCSFIIADSGLHCKAKRWIGRKKAAIPLFPGETNGGRVHAG